MWLTIGLKAFVLVHLPILMYTVSAGVWLFYVQHQFEETYWHEHERWSYFDAGLEESSHLVLPKWLQWITASIGIHHIHHVSARIPNYKLQECLDDIPEFQEVTRISIWDGIRTLRLSLWHEDTRRLVSFSEARRLARTGTAATVVCASALLALLIGPQPLTAQQVVEAGSDEFEAERAMLLDSTVYVRFDVKDTWSLREALDEELLQAQTRLLIMEHPKGRLALVTDQMAYHHTAQGEIAGEPWMVSF